MDKKGDKVLAEGVSATQYQGTFVVNNGTGQVITNVSVKHTCGDFVNTSVAVSLQPGESTPPVLLQAQTGSNDDWSLSFQMGNVSRSRNSKQCNYETEDAPNTCIIALYDDSFSVITPKSSPCLNNSYD
ncbi:hypothetical protein DYQ93_19780 [Xanthomonas sp. LMG 8992]|uniref:hypothetical protein n=1 Tax=Xanthomonas sp. LMG 8992 TaxID=1591157 RepID=UPI00136DCA3F|nr:hypothetical protein [Xanthomonas sp. LMG 8992]MXV13247.1 hypothetical protein [Xanthomonas sp. LMG 8992]